MNLIRNLLSGKITFAIRVGGHIKKIRAWTTRRAIMFLSARESPRPTQPSDLCPLLISCPLRTKKYPLNIPHPKIFRGQNMHPSAEKSQPRRNLKNIASRFTGILYSLRTIFFRHDARHPEVWHPYAAVAFLSNIDLSMRGRMCSLPLSVSFFSGRDISKTRLTERNEISSRIGAHVECKK